MVVRHLRDRLARERLERIAAAQAGFFEPYRGKYGPGRVAEYIRHLVGPG
jgi:hypothetical protein